jgi:pyruvate-formate lyase
VNPDTPEDVLREAAKTVLSGGAQPFFFNDDMITNSLAHFGSGMDIPIEDARDFCADGCYEPVFAGKTDFSLIYTPITNAMEATLNLGATYINAGPTYLRGNNVSFQSPKPEDINSFEEFLEIFYRHYHWLAASAINLIISNYGNLWKVCPSPLLSSLTDGCMASGRDLNNGGAKHHMIAPMMLGISCVIDSLWAIKTLVFEEYTAVTTLSELRECLLCDWGYDMIEPLHVKTAGPERAELKSHRFKFLREKALKLKKFGSGDNEIDTFGGKVAEKIARIYMELLENPEKAIGTDFKKTLDDIKKKYSSPGHPHKFKLTPAFGTFEDYLGVSLSVGASADGRRKGKSFASNFSPMPSPCDLPPESKPREIFKALKGWNLEAFKYAHNFPTPVDINIREDFPLEKIVELLKAFGRSELGFNILTITCVNRETLEKAVEFPEQYDLVRCRLGGWSEFYITMFPDYQQQQLRRPLFVLDDE